MNLIRQWVRRVLPLSLRQTLAQMLRQLNDWKNNINFDKTHVNDLTNYHLHVELTQPIMPSALFENKLANLRQCARRLNHLRITPTSIWSFWHTVGAPTEANGFVIGRNLVNGELIRQVGGGLCQPSSLMYHLALLSGLTIVERYPHSIDIYEEKDRFTPLGADATVVWGFKDLRLINPHAVDVVFEYFVEGHSITGRVYARGKLPSYDVQFIRKSLSPPMIQVDTLVNGNIQTQTTYQQQQGMCLENTPNKQ